MSERRVRPKDDRALSGYRTYEVFQRERVGETTDLLSPRELISDEVLSEPHRLLSIMREHYPCYRDWTSNRFWITRYDDVTSIFTDDANFATRSKRWELGIDTSGRDLWHHVPVLTAHEHRIDSALSAVIGVCLDDLDGRVDLVTEWAARLPLELWGAILDVPEGELPHFAKLLWRMVHGTSWDALALDDARSAFDEMVAWVTPLFERRRAAPGNDLISAIAAMELDDAPSTPEDVATTILEADHETLHGGLANLWCLLLTHPSELDRVRADRRLMKFAWLEALRHSPPIHSAERFARHEVERFGRLIPDGGLLYLSAAAANRDPRAFEDPDSFIVGRTDLCQREPRGQYRADGLPSGITFGLGRPSQHPAVPKERPRSMYAITRDVAVAASTALLYARPDLRLLDGATPTMRSLRLGDMFTCWSLAVTG